MPSNPGGERALLAALEREVGPLPVPDLVVEWANTACTMADQLGMGEAFFAEVGRRADTDEARGSLWWSGVIGITGHAVVHICPRHEAELTEFMQVMLGDVCAAGPPPELAELCAS